MASYTSCGGGEIRSSRSSCAPGARAARRPPRRRTFNSMVPSCSCLSRVSWAAQRGVTWCTTRDRCCELCNEEPIQAMGNERRGSQHSGRREETILRVLQVRLVRLESADFMAIGADDFIALQIGLHTQLHAANARSMRPLPRPPGKAHQSCMSPGSHQQRTPTSYLHKRNPTLNQQSIQHTRSSRPLAPATSRRGKADTPHTQPVGLMPAAHCHGRASAASNKSSADRGTNNRQHVMCITLIMAAASFVAAGRAASRLRRAIGAAISGAVAACGCRLPPAAGHDTPRSPHAPAASPRRSRDAAGMRIPSPSASLQTKTKV